MGAYNLWNTGAGTKFWKSDWYSVLKGRRTFDPFAEQNEHIHSAQKKLVTRPYSMETLKDLQPYVDNTIVHFIERMEEKRSGDIDLGKWVQLFAFGKSFPCPGDRFACLV